MFLCTISSIINPPPPPGMDLIAGYCSNSDEEELQDPMPTTLGQTLDTNSLPSSTSPSPMTECISPRSAPQPRRPRHPGFASASASACLGFDLLFWNEVRVFLSAPAFLLRRRDGAAGVAGERSRVEGGRPRARWSRGDGADTRAHRRTR